MKKKEETKKKVMSDIGKVSTWRDVILPSALEYQKNYYCLGDVYCRTYTIYNYPEKVAAYWLKPITRMDNVIVSVNTTQGNPAELKKSIDFTISEEQQRMRQNMDTGRLSEVQDSEDRIAKALELSQRLLGEGSSVENVTIYITVYAPHKEDLDQICQDVEGKLGGNGFIPRNIPYKSEEGMKSMYPIAMNLYKGYTGLDMPSDVFYAGLPMFTAASMNDKNGYFVGVDTSRNPVFLDVWEKSYGKTNSNMFVLGQSGSGKSAFSKALLVHELSHNSKMIIMDVEEEYISFAKAFNGNIINATGDGVNSSILNPLQLRDVPSAYDEFETEQKLAEFIERMKSSGTDFRGALSSQITFLKGWFQIYLPELTQSHIALLETSLYEMYANYDIDEFTDPRKLRNDQYPVLSDLYDVVKKHSDIEPDSSKQKLYSELLVFLESCVTGADRFLFNGRTNVDLSNSLNVINVSKLVDAPTNIKNAQFYNITSFAWLEMTKDRNQKTIFDVDEAHMFINEDSKVVASFLSSLSKRARKYRSALWVATQNIKDFLHPSIDRYGTGIMQNCSTCVFFRSTATDLEKIAGLFKLNEGEADLVESATTGNCLLLAGNSRQFVGVNIEPHILDLVSAGGGR